jgi:hypothetical protein
MSRHRGRGLRSLGQTTALSVLAVVNLEEGMPTTEGVRVRLAEELRRAHQQRLPAIKLIHGYGSSGIGGALREAVLGTLGWAKTQREIREFIVGEDWSISNDPSWRLLQQHRGLRTDSDLGRRNRGITIVIL